MIDEAQGLGGGGILGLFREGLDGGLEIAVLRYYVEAGAIGLLGI